MEEKEKIIKKLNSSEVIPTDELDALLRSEDKDIKHEAWNYVLRHQNDLGREYLIQLLRFDDTGTRYRAWNEAPNFISNNVLTMEDVRKNVEYFFQLLKDKNLTVRVLSWYVTLIPLINVGIIGRDEVRPYLKWLCELKDEVLDEVKEELGIRC